MRDCCLIRIPVLLCVCVCRSIGRPKHVKVMAGAVEGSIFVGERARDLKGLLRLQHATQRSTTHGGSALAINQSSATQSHGATVTDWDAMHSLWQHVYSELACTSDAHPVLLTEAPLCDRRHRAKAAELFFESFQAPALYMQTQAILALYASGRTSGVVVDCGDLQCSVVPVYEGFMLPHAVQRIDLGGRDVTQYLQLLLRKSGTALLQTSAELEVVRDLKEKVCYVAYNLAAHEKGSAAMSAASLASLSTAGSGLGSDLNLSAYDLVEPIVPYKLPDGSILQIGAEKYRAPELLFNPALIGSEQQGLHQLLHTSIARCDLDLRRALYSHIILCGGTSQFDGLGDRLLSETRRLASRDTKIKIWAPPERVVSVWCGGSILASLSTFKQVWISKRQYQEEGKSIMHRRAY